MTLEKMTIKPAEPNQNGEPDELTIICNNMTLHDHTGRQFAHYDSLEIPFSSIDTGGKRISWNYWDEHFSGSDDMWMNAPTWYQVLEAAWKERGTPQAKQVKAMFDADFAYALELGTKVVYDKDYETAKAVHSIGPKNNTVSLDVNMPRRGSWNHASIVQQDPEWTPFLQTMTGSLDVSNLADVLEWATDRDPVIYISPSYEPEHEVERMVQVYRGGSFNDFGIISCSLPHLSRGHARRVIPRIG